MGSPWPPLLLPPTTMCPSLLPVINPLLLLLLLLILWTSKSRRRNDSRGHVLKGFECFGSPNGHSFTIENRRMMNASAVATALRPFYFAVHPDLFGRFPEYRVSKYLFYFRVPLKLFFWLRITDIHKLFFFYSGSSPPVLTRGMTRLNNSIELSLVAVMPIREF